MTKKKEKCPVVKGQYYAAKYRGDGGDLTIGQVQSVRTARKPGDKAFIVSINLLNGRTSTKKIDVFLQRNKRVSKSQSKKIISAFKKGGKDAARMAAIAAPEFRNGRGQEQLQLPTTPTLNINEGIKELLESKGCEVKEEVGIWTVTTPEGEIWDFTTPQKKEKPDPSTKIIVWGSWETVENFGTKDADFLGDGEVMCLGAFDTVEEAENYIMSIESKKHLIEGCPGV